MDALRHRRRDGIARPNPPRLVEMFRANRPSYWLLVAFGLGENRQSTIIPQPHFSFELSLNYR